MTNREKNWRRFVLMLMIAGGLKAIAEAIKGKE
jgi:hypothetical protein